MKSDHCRTNSLPRWGRYLFFSILALGMLGCGFFGGKKKPVPPPKITFTIKSDFETNYAQPFYLLFRTVNEQQFVTESYQDVAKIVFASPPDASVLGNHAVLPGEKEEMDIDKPMKDSVGVYGLFTEPSRQWKVMLSSPLDSEYVIAFKKNTMTVKKKKGLFRRLIPWGGD